MVCRGGRRLNCSALATRWVKNARQGGAFVKETSDNVGLISSGNLRKHLSDFVKKPRLLPQPPRTPPLRLLKEFILKPPGDYFTAPPNMRRERRYTNTETR